MRECERLLLAFKLAGWLNEYGLGLQAVIMCYGLLAPIIYYKLVNLATVQVSIHLTIHFTNTTVVLYGFKFICLEAVYFTCFSNSSIFYPKNNKSPQVELLNLPACCYQKVEHTYIPAFFQVLKKCLALILALPQSVSTNIKSKGGVDGLHHMTACIIYYLVMGLRAFREESLATEIAGIGHKLLSGEIWKEAGADSTGGDKERTAASQMRFQQTLMLAEDTGIDLQGDRKSATLGDLMKRKGFLPPPLVFFLPS